jgi:hypothetical protein
MTIDIDEGKVGHSELGMWVGWTMATALGMLVGFLLTIPLVNWLDLPIARLAVPVVAGTLIGFAQWIVLKQYVTASTDWILAGGAAWAAGYALGLLLMLNLPNTLFAGLVGSLIFGVIVALIQWPVLRREIPNAMMWILSSAMGWSIGYLASQGALSLFAGTSAIHPALSTSVIAGTNGLVAGAITGFALVRIVRQPEKAL